MLSSDGIPHFVCVATGYGRDVMTGSDAVTVGVGRSYEPSYQSAATAIAEKQIEINKNLI